MAKMHRCKWLLKREDTSNPQVKESQTRQWVLECLRDRWLYGVLESSQDGVLHMDLPVTLFSLYEPQSPDQINATTLFSETRMLEIYDQAHGDLLIVGEPGSGKTTLLLELLAALL